MKLEQELDLRQKILRISAKLDQAKNNFEKEYEKVREGSTSLNLLLSRNDLIAVLNVYRELAEKVLSMEKNNWINEIQKLSGVATLDIGKLHKLDGISIVENIKNDIESFKTGLIQKIRLREELKSSFNSVIGKDTELDEEIHKMHVIVDEQIQFEESKVLKIDKIIQIVDINLNSVKKDSM